MSSIMRNIFGMLVLGVMLQLAGCYSTPVRNLASDVALIKSGESHKQDVVAFLGDPDEKVTAENGVEKWLFREKESSWLKSTPGLKRFLPKKKEEVIVVMFKGDLVVSSQYRAIEYEETKWANDFDWQEKKQ